MTISDENGAKTHDVPLANLESLTVLGGVQISTQAITLLSQRGVPIAILSAGGRLTAMVDPLDSASAETRRAQVRKFDRAEPCLELARALIVAKIANQRKLLMRNHVCLPGRVAEALGRAVAPRGQGRGPGIAARARGPGGRALFRALFRHDQVGPGRRVRRPRPAASPAARSGQRLPFLRLFDADPRMHGGPADRAAGAVDRGLSRLAAWPARLGAGPDGALPAADRRFRGDYGLQPRRASGRPFPPHGRRRRLHRRRPQGLFRRLRAADGRGGHAPGLRATN